MQFKTPQIKLEYETLVAKNYALWTLLNLTEAFSVFELNKSIMITHIFRTPEEQKALYSQTPNPPATSPHERWEAADLRSSIYTEREITRLLTFLNTFTYQGGQRKVAIYHAVAGNVNHFHIQYKGA